MTYLRAFKCDPLTPYFSPIELFFLLHWEELGYQVIDCLDLRSIYCVRRTCSVMRSVIHLYTWDRWNPRALVGSFVNDVPRFLSFLREADALVLGPNIRHLMERQMPRHFHPLNICIKRTSAGRIDWLMGQEGLVFERMYPTIHSLQSSLVHYEHARMGPAGSCKSDVVIFRFHRMAFTQMPESYNFICQSVIVHVVRCDAIEYVVGLPTSE